MTEKHRIAKSRVGTNYTTLPSNDKTNIYTAATRERDIDGEVRTERISRIPRLLLLANAYRQGNTPPTR